MIKTFKLNYDLIQQHMAKILDIENQCMHKFMDMYDTKAWTEKEFLAKRPKKDEFSCAISDDDQWIGFSIAYEVDKFQAHISRVAVLSSPSKKYGSSLLDFQLRLFQKHKIKTCSVDLISKNEIAYGLYNKRDFVKLEGSELIEYLNFRERDHNEYTGNIPSHVVMIKKFV